MTYFTLRSSLVTLTFAWAKVKIMYNLETKAAISSKIGLSIQINKLMKLHEYQRSRSLSDLGQRSLKIQNENLIFLGNCWVIWNQISYESLWMNGNEKLYK